ncbi:MAG: ABC transporter ATP-binding protein [Clostridia bacterium]|nr:ABC transporter ATP-binding protein [Clostridia bacterium]MBP3495871.1 ABC transporter ATP-binding protein [Clostridia bacterium]MBQ7788400.1 ABC transporter ATP-binding protein [Clostridia bacterium]
MAKLFDKIKSFVDKKILKNTHKRENIQSDFVLETRGLGISFGGLKAAQNVNLRIKKNEIYGLIGPNGAGKTTVFNLLTGVYQPTEGAFYLNGEDLTALPQDKINHKGIARTFQNIRLFNNMTVIRNVMVGLANQPEYNCSLFESIFRLPRHFKVEKAMRQRAKEILRIFDLEDERNNLACNLPYGKQRKLEIARALATNPKLLLLDEPAAGMNPNETEDLVNTIKTIRDNFDMTILLIEHDMKFVSGLCDEITVLNFGTVLAEGDTKTALNNPDVIKAYIGG